MNPSTDAEEPAVQGPDFLVRQPGQVGLHQVADDLDAQVPLDPGAGVLDQVAAEDLQQLAE